MKNRLSKWWILVVAIIPFLLMFCLHIGIALGSYFGININVPNVDASTWFIFCGNYLGGTMTLAGVMLTLRHEHNIHQYEKSMDSIDKEKDALGKAICDLNVFAPSALYQQFNSLHITSNGYDSVEVAAIRRQLSEEMQKINALKQETLFFTEIYAMTAGCSACKKPCKVQSVLPEFQKIYEKVGSKLFGLLQMIDTYVAACVSNALYQALVTNCQQNNQQNQALGQPPEYSEAEIETHKSKIIDIEPQRKNLLAIMEEISQYNQNEIQQLSVLAREYIAVKQQNAYEKCFFDKKRR
ncbi:MAG: hypothetical protein NC251_11850 [Lachnoclostridium sp.]|nr:hypothetical protein [Lachnoclostridium sp.]MCM1535143.1 hypothetical protein [Clostridium sp.]